jgi:hypothetical protein
VAFLQQQPGSGRDGVNVPEEGSAVHHPPKQQKLRHRVRAYECGAVQFEQRRDLRGDRDAVPVRAQVKRLDAERVPEYLDSAIRLPPQQRVHPVTVVSGGRLPLR